MESAVEEDPSDTLRIGDIIFLCASKKGGYVFSRISSNSSSLHRSVALSSPKEPLQYVQYATFEIKAAQQQQSAVEKKPIVYGDKIQLQHAFTRKFLAVLTSCVSSTDTTELKVELLQQSDNCTFTVLPHQRDHYIGDEVHFGDEIKLESLTVERMFLHWSEKPFEKDNPLYSDCFELNISARTDRRSFKIEPFYRPSQSVKHQSEVFRAGNAVLLFNKENECYVRAEGSFGRNIVPVHCRKCRATAAGLRLQCSSADRFWQFEKKDLPMNGEPVSWNEYCYIKHLPTLCYLTAQSESDGNKFQLTLKPWNEVQENKSASLFYISPLKEGTTDCKAIFMVKTFVKIKHVHDKSCLWLHVHKESESQGQSDDKKTFQLDLSPECASTFLFDVVTPEYVRHFHYVAGIVPVLTSYLEQCQKDQCLSDSQDVRYTLDNLSDFIIKRLRPEGLKSRQKLLRNLQVLEIITDILALYNGTIGPTQSHMSPAEIERLCSRLADVCRSCYKVFQSYLRGGSRKNKEYLQREGYNFIRTFWNQLDQGLGAEETLVMLFEDNLDIICNPQKLQIGCEDMSGLIAKLSGMVDITRKKTHNYMRMISALCSFEGRPVRAVQNAVLKEFIKKRGNELFCSVTKKQGEDTLVFRQHGEDHQCDRNLSEVDEDDKKFLESQLQLLSSVRKGNSGAQEYVDKHCLFDDAYCCIGHEGEKLGKRVQARYVDLLTVMFVEDEASTVSGMFPLLAVNGQDGDDDLQPPTTEVEKLMEWINAEVMNKDEKMIAKDDDENYLLLKILDLIYALVQHGYYFNVKNTRKLLKKLLCLLDGSTDQPEHNASSDACTLFNTKRRFEFVHQNSSLFAVKQRAMEVIDLMWNIHLHRLLKDFVLCFNTLEGHSTAKPQELVQYRQYLMMSQDKFSSLQEKNPALFTKLSAAVRRHMEQVIFTSSTWPFHDLQKFSDIMLDLARYEKDELIQTSLHLLNQFYSCEATLFDRAAQLQLLKKNSAGHKIYKDVQQKHPEIRHFVSIIGADTKEFCTMLDEFAGLCRLVEGHHEPQNQAILYNSGVVDDVIDYVLRNPSRLYSIGNDCEQVFGICFNFLADVACKNPPIKKWLFSHLNEFLEIEVAVPLLAKMVTEIFDGGPSLCLKVNEEQVEMIFHKIQKTATSDPDGCVELLITLQAIAKVVDLHLPLKRNQTIIIHCFNGMRRGAFDGFLQKSDDRWRILTAANETPELRLLMEVTNLLASCAEGENAYIESLCQTIYTQQELLVILMAPEDRLEHSSKESSHKCIPVERKGPFLRYLHWVYMSTKHCDHKRDASLACSFWHYMGLLKARLETVSDSLLSEGKSHSREIRVALTSKHRRQSLSERSPEAVLYYFLEAVLPMLKIFYLKFFPLLKEEDEGYAEKAKTSAAICHNLLRLSGEVQGILANERQLQVYKEAVMALLTNKHVWIGLLTTPRYREGFSRFDETFTRQRRLETLPHHSTYQETSTEKQVNKMFHTFVLNYTTSWEGRNTAEVQVGSEFKQPYNAHESEQIQKGDWNLPLGTRFQEHVNLFLINSDGEKRVRPNVEVLIEQLSVSFRRSFRKHFIFSSEADFCRHVRLNIKCLQLLRAIIRNRLQRIDSDLQVTNPKEFQMKCKKELHPWQKEIQDRGTIDAVISFLVHPHEAISREVLALLNSILTSASIDIIRGLAPLLENDQRMECFTSVMHKKFQEASLKCRASLAFLEELQLQRVKWKEVKREYLSNQKIHAAKMSIGENQLKAAIERKNARDEPISPDQTAVTIEGCRGIRRRQRQMRQRSPEPASQVINGRHPGLEELTELGSDETDYSPVMHQAFFRQASVPHADPLDTATGTVKWNIVLDTLLRVHCSSYIRLALKFLDHACSMQYSDMQNYLRERPNHVSPINVVGDVALFLENLQDGEQFYFQPFQFNFVDDVITEKEVKLKWRKENAQLIHLALQSLTKFCIGNQQNKEAVFNRRILDVINCVLRVDIQKVEEEVEDFNRSIENERPQPGDAENTPRHSTETDSSAEPRKDTYKRLKKCSRKAKESVTRLIKLKGSAVQLLEVLLEKTDDAADQLARVVYRSLDVKALLKTMVELYQHRSSHVTGRHIQKPCVCRFGKSLAERYLLKSYHIMKMFVDYSCLTQQDLVAVAAPVITTVQPTSPTSIMVEWTQQGDVDSFEIAFERVRATCSREHARQWRTVHGTVPVNDGTARQHTVTGLQEDSTYSFTITAINIYGRMSLPSGSRTATTKQGVAVAAPVITTVQPASPTSIMVEWTQQGDVDSFKIAFERVRAICSRAHAPQWRTVRGTVPLNDGTARQHTVTGLQEDSTYSFTITAISIYGRMSLPSGSMTATTEQAVTVAAPVITTVQPASPTSIMVEWIQQGDVDSFEIAFEHVRAICNRAHAPQWRTVRGTVPLNDGTARQHTVTGLQEDSTYSFTITAISIYGRMSLPSGSRTATTEQGVAVAAPVVTTVQPASPTSIMVEWTQQGDVDSFEIAFERVRAICSRAHAPQWKTVRGTARQHTVTGLQEDSTYSFTITAISIYGRMSLPSGSRTATTKKGVAVAAPVITVVQPVSPTSIMVGWTQQGDVNYFEIAYERVTGAMQQGPCPSVEHSGTVTVSDGAARQKTVSGLEEFSTYSFTITAISNGRMSLPSGSMTATTKQGVRTALKVDNKMELKVLKDTWTFCETHTKTVEVRYKGMNGKFLTRLHFDYNPKYEIREEVRNIAKWKVNRDSAEDKLRDFLDWTEALKEDIKWQHTLALKEDMEWQHKLNLKFQRQLKKVKLFSWTRQWLLVFLTLLLNLFVFINFTVPSEIQANPSNESATDNSSDSTVGGLVWPPETRDWFKIVLYSFGIPHAILSFWMLVEYFVLYWPHFLYKKLKLKKFIREYFHSVLYEKSPRLWKKLKIGSNLCPKRPYLQRHIFGFWSLYLLAFLAASVLSLVYCGYFYCLCLLHLLVTSELLQRVLHAIFLTWKSLVLVGLLGLVVLIIYAVASFAWLQNAFVSSENPLFCSTPGECFVTLLRYGVLGKILIPTDPEEFDQFGLRVLVNVVFLILWVIIGLNIIVGLLLQSFLDLHHKRNKAKEDMHSRCFICSIPSYEFELWAEPRTFAVHILNDHNMWDYVYLSLYLDYRGIDEHTAVEKYVFDELQQHNIGFFPLKFSRALKRFKEEGSELEALREHLKKKESEMATLHERLNEKDERLNEEGSELATLRVHLKEKESELTTLREHLRKEESEKLRLLHEFYSTVPQQRTSEKDGKQDLETTPAEEVEDWI